MSSVKKYINLFNCKSQIFYPAVLSIPGQGSCSGDSGGPLVWREYSDDPWYQIGLVSFGAVKCGTKDIPGVYTRVEAYLPWIESNLEA